ncbi:hypothetical protein [Nostoc sp. FACHB-888]|uniref:hypothetical protein n=1 Tax=Nostoc sp. FACHB-888 TaxID=2692842 RepID=UPI001687FF18|nr:hypothetical protein [Nostoc sp. FACHB-888]MBD2247776.1 hypothetical protein [Nostoc sp. FACHB-888]
MKRNLIVAAVVFLIYICLGMNTPANALGAKLIPIKNAGFEEPIVKVEDDYTIETPLGWTTYNPNGLIPAKRKKWTSSLGSIASSNFSSTGVGNPAPSHYYFGEAQEGENVGIVFLPLPLGSGIAGLEQTLDAVLEPNTKYTLTVDIGNTGGDVEGLSLHAGFPGYRVELLAGNTVLAADHNNLYIKERTFKTSTVTFTTTPECPYLGEKLGIRLINLLQGSPWLADTDFDNVRLTTEPVKL